MVFFVLARFVPVKYSRAFVERPSQGTSSLASRLTTVSLDLRIAKKRKRIPVVKERRPKFEFVRVSIQKPSHGMKRNLVGELCMY